VLTQVLPQQGNSEVQISASGSHNDAGLEHGPDQRHTDVNFLRCLFYGQEAPGPLRLPVRRSP
jgi:hypothetical protein